MLSDPDPVRIAFAPIAILLSPEVEFDIAATPIATLLDPGLYVDEYAPRATLLESVLPNTPPILLGVAFARSKVPEVVIVQAQNPVPAVIDVTVP
jgi:hypothetical protein